MWLSDEPSDVAKRAHMDRVGKAMASLAWPPPSFEPGDVPPMCSKFEVDHDAELPWERTAFVLEFTNGVKLTGLLKDVSVG